MKAKKIYVAGPMTGLPEFNYPAFNAAAAALRKQGHTVFNPAENPTPPCGTWEAYMCMAISQLVQCDTIVLLPGWSNSRGAVIERKLAQDLGKQVDMYMGADPSRWDDGTLRSKGGAFDILYKRRKPMAPCAARKPRKQPDQSHHAKVLRDIANEAPNFNTKIDTQADSDRTARIRGRGNK